MICSDSLYKTFFFFFLMAFVSTLIDFSLYRYWYEVRSKLLLPLAALINAITWTLMCMHNVGFFSGYHDYIFFSVIFLIRLIGYGYVFWIIEHGQLVGISLIFPVLLSYCVYLYFYLIFPFLIGS